MTSSRLKPKSTNRSNSTLIRLLNSSIPSHYNQRRLYGTGARWSPNWNSWAIPYRLFINLNKSTVATRGRKWTPWPLWSNCRLIMRLSTKSMPNFSASSRSLKCLQSMGTCKSIIPRSPYNEKVINVPFAVERIVRVPTEKVYFLRESVKVPKEV